MEKQNKINVIVLGGQTAAGKSSLAVRLCESFGGEIISADSMQVYRGMDIGTAKPSGSDRARVRHHLLDILDIGEAFSAADFAARARAALSDISSGGKVPLAVGGTGLYAEMLFRYGAPPEGVQNPRVRAALLEKAREDKNALYERLKTVDPEAASKTHPNNIKRVVRYLEVYEITGKTPTEVNKQRDLREKIYRPLYLCLFSEDREYIYERINLRVEEMFEKGLVREAHSLWERGLEHAPTASAAIGYKELFPHFRGKISLCAAKENIKKSTRNYAKRQLTYFKRIKGTVFIDIKNKNYPDEAEKAAAAFLGGAKAGPLS